LCVVKTSVGQVLDFCDNHQFQANETTESKNCWVWVFAKASESKNCQFKNFKEPPGFMKNQKLELTVF
jgi:hypothetical protein